MTADRRPGAGATRGVGPLQIGRRAGLAIVLTSLAGLAMFCWPLLLDPGSGRTSHQIDAPFAFMLLLPALLAVVLSEVGSGVLDAKALAMLGVLAALGAALRPLGAGTAGIETVFFLLVLAGRVYGPGFGFVLGSTTLFASALLTGGVGPWMPFQMLAGSWIGLFAGLLPRASGKREIALLAGYGVVCAYVFGALLNLSFWPFTIGTGTGTDLAFVPGDAVLTNLHRFWLYDLATSAWGFDTGRAITNAICIVVVGPTLLATLRRASRRAAFDAPVEFAPHP
jgi:energy-coupling factor transport system substrate-specific component